MYLKISQEQFYWLLDLFFLLITSLKERNDNEYKNNFQAIRL